MGKGLRGAEGQAVGDRGELVAGANAIVAEARLEDAADGGNERAAAGEEDAIDLAGIDTGGLEERVDGVLDGLQIVCDP